MSTHFESTGKKRSTPVSNDPEIEAARQNFERQKATHSNAPPPKETFTQRMKRKFFENAPVDSIFDRK